MQTEEHNEDLSVTLPSNTTQVPYNETIKFELPLLMSLTEQFEVRKPKLKIALLTKHKNVSEGRNWVKLNSSSKKMASTKYDCESVQRRVRIL
jgi:hypothetical protein